MKLSKEQAIREKEKDAIIKAKKYKDTLYSLLKLVTEIKYVFPKTATRCIICDNYYKKEIMYYAKVNMASITSNLAPGTPFGKYNYFTHMCRNCCKNKKAVRKFLTEKIYNPTFAYEIANISNKQAKA